MELNNHSQNQSAHHDSLVYLWRQRSLFINRPHHSRHRKYYADCILFGFDGTLKVTLDNGKVIKKPMIMVPADTRFYMAVEGETLGVLCLDYLGLDFKQCQQLAKQVHNNFYFDFDHTIQQQLLASVKYIHQQGCPIEETEKRIIDALNLDRTLDQFEPNTFPQKPDPRLSQIISLYLNGELDLNAPLSQAAKTINLSVSRINQLFSQHLNTSFRTFRNRQKIHINLIASAFGKSNTQAALEAGFVDQAHFCKRFKDTTGINVSAYRAKTINRKCFVEKTMAERYLNNQPIYGVVRNRLIES